MPRSDIMTAVLPNNELVVVGGMVREGEVLEICDYTETMHTVCSLTPCFSLLL